MLVFLGCEHTLLAHVQLFIHQYAQVLLGRSALNPFIPHPILIPGVALSQVQDPALGLVELHEVHMGPLLELVQAPMDGIQSLRHDNCTTQFLCHPHLGESVLNPTVYVMNEVFGQCWSQYGPQESPLVTDLHLDIELFTTTLWMQPSNQFLIHQTVHPSNPYLSNLERRMLWETMSKALQESR
ncbi:hypothetical protein llap_5686 [Limosa lapponica baueri]|uniref:Uncharacterized protein n=1 Tax=Limosa lapponica baueri TaxID=1758121 RepID=A0A2I0UD95_LIMLA|nr:hypothetical protein llap_5686 [Limosa lapponica baueri]